MSSKNQHVQDNSVVERRLRPIYDWLDIGNNKKALQECEKVLKKTPGLQCAKALKALTLHRMNKEVEAGAILDSLTAENPTDDATLQAITLCYKELQQMEKICTLYETAVKLDSTNEELITHLFMSYARIFDFKSQQKTAMTLYKHKPKTPYYCWAVMSIILQATRGEGKNDLKKRNLLLSLAERMMEKLVLDGKLDAEQEVQLYVMVLELQDKYEEILTILDSPLGAKLACSNVPINRLRYLLFVKKWSEVNLLCKGVLIENVDRWNIWKEYIKSVFELMGDKAYSETNNHDNHDGAENDVVETVDDTPEKCHEFICRIVENGTENGYLLRGPYLARFELCTKLLQSKMDPSDVLGETIELFIEYFRKFGHKSCCVSDLRIYIHLLDNEKRAELSLRLIKDVGISSTSVPQSEQQMQRHLCALQLSRLCGAHRNLSADHLKALVTAFSLHYEHGYQTYGTNLLSTDLGPSDPYAILAAHVLYDLARTEGKSTPIIMALVLLENLLKNSPSNFHAKLLSVRLYHTLGGSLGAQNWYNSLDTKHLQLDSLGFIHCARLATTGLFSFCSILFDLTLKFFSSNYKDSSDHITFSYKYGSFVKLNEFMDFRERLNNSLHYTTVAVDRIILDLIECTSVDGLYNIDISPKDDKIYWETLRDNQDLSVYLSWDPERNDLPPEELPEIKLYVEQNILFLKLRTFPLWALSGASDILKSTDGVRVQHIEKLRNTLDEWMNISVESKAQKHIPLRQNQVTLPLPSRLHIALETPHELIVYMFKIFVDIALERPTIDVTPISNGLKELLDLIEGRTKSGDNIEPTFRRETLEFFVNSVEIVSICSLVCLLCNELVKPTQSKKGKRKPVDSAYKDQLSQLATSLISHINQLSNLLVPWANFTMSSDFLDTFDSLNMNSGNAQSVCENIVQSYSFAAREIQSVLKNKVKMLNCVQ